MSAENIFDLEDKIKHIDVKDKKDTIKKINNILIQLYDNYKKYEEDYTQIRRYEDNMEQINNIINDSKYKEYEGLSAILKYRLYKMKDIGSNYPYTHPFYNNFNYLVKSNKPSNNLLPFVNNRKYITLENIDENGINILTQDITPITHKIKKLFEGIPNNQLINTSDKKHRYIVQGLSDFIEVNGDKTFNNDNNDIEMNFDSIIYNILNHDDNSNLGKYININNNINPTLVEAIKNMKQQIVTKGYRKYLYIHESSKKQNSDGLNNKVESSYKNSKVYEDILPYIQQSLSSKGGPRLHDHTNYRIEIISHGYGGLEIVQDFENGMVFEDTNNAEGYTINIYFDPNGAHGATVPDEDRLKEVKYNTTVTEILYPEYNFNRWRKTTPHVNSDKFSTELTSWPADRSVFTFLPVILNYENGKHASYNIYILHESLESLKLDKRCYGIIKKLHNWQLEFWHSRSWKILFDEDE